VTILEAPANPFPAGHLAWVNLSLPSRGIQPVVDRAEAAGRSIVERGNR
jgi:hypothetical protein